MQEFHDVGGLRPWSNLSAVIDTNANSKGMDGCVFEPESASELVFRQVILDKKKDLL
jgi:hypothetical protein